MPVRQSCWTGCAGSSGHLWVGSVKSVKKALHMQHFFACVHRQQFDNALWSNQGTALHLLMIVARHRGGHSIGLLQGTLGLGDSPACRFLFLGGKIMLKSCQYCGRIHPRGYMCPQKPKQAHHRNEKTSSFRKTYTWQKKRNQIVSRDYHLCRICNEGSYGVYGVPGLDQELSVHHIEPLEERFDLRLDDGNLLTCCSRHHRMADDGDIPRDYLHGLTEVPPRWE